MGSNIQEQLSTIPFNKVPTILEEVQLPLFILKGP